MATNTKSGKDWGLFFSGLVVVICGAVILFWPGLSLLAIASFAGVLLIFAGVFDIVNYMRFRGTEATNGWAIVNAICCFILGAMFILNPVISAAVVPTVCAIFVIAYGIIALAAAFKLRSLPGWGFMLVNGIISILCGIMFVALPETFAIFLGVFIVMRGVSMAYYGLTDPTGLITIG